MGLGFELRVVFLLGLLFTLIAGVFGSTLERSIRANADVAQVQTTTVGAATATDAAIGTPAVANVDVDLALASSIGQAEPLLLLLLGSMLFCVAFGISALRSRTAAK